MKRSYVSVILLCGILMLNLILTQYMVHQYFYEHFTNTLISGAFNVLLFPVAIFIYKRDKKLDKGMNNHE